MDISTQIKNYLQQSGKTHSWKEIAEMFNVQGTPKQKSDYVRRLASRINNPTLFPISVEKIWNEDNGMNYFDYSTSLAVDQNMKADFEYEQFLKWKESKVTIIPTTTRNLPQPYTKGNKDNVLIIPDLHLPFEISDALEFCRSQQERFNCGTVIFIGDVIDTNFSSFHNTDPDGMSAVMELDEAIRKLEDWYHVFPNAIVTLGNHDRIIARKLFSAGVSKRWMRPLGEVLNTPNWEFVEQVIHNNVLYVHGEGGSARKKAMHEMISTVSGHAHTEGYTEILPGVGGQRFAMQVGTLIDFKQYTFAYAQRGRQPVLSCGIVINGVAPILIPYV